MREKPRGGTFCHELGFSSTRQRGDKRKGTIFWPFCTFWTRVAITAPRRPKRTKPGSKAVWVLVNQPVAGFARRFGHLARQHVCCGAHMCPFQGQKSALGANLGGVGSPCDCDRPWCPPRLLAHALNLCPRVYPRLIIATRTPTSELAWNAKSRQLACATVVLR